MSGPVVSRSRAQRCLQRELCRLVEHYSRATPCTRECLTEEALRLAFGRLCAEAGLAGTEMGSEGDVAAPELPAQFRCEVRELMSRWQWGLNGSCQLGPDTLGYLYEQSLARKEMGAYFTAPDVAAYVCRSTLLPRLLDLVGIPLEPTRLTGEEGVLRYLPQCLRQAERLPLETDYEQRERTRRVAETIVAWNAGRIATADECVTWNLDLRQLALDSIERQPEVQVAKRWEEAIHALRVLDPTCGSGDFLLAAYDLLAQLLRACQIRLNREPGTSSFELLRGLYGIDLLPGAVEVSRRRLYLRAAQLSPGTALRLPSSPQSPLRCADFLAEGPLAPTPTFGAAGYSGFDAVVGNPPYVACSEKRDWFREQGYRTADGGNLYALVMERSLAQLVVGGRLGMIAPISSVSVPEFQPLVDRLTTGTCWVSTYSNRPAKLFENVEQRLAIWLAAPTGAERLYVSRYQHWWRKERRYLFERLQYCESDRRGDSRLPVKTGSSTAERIYQRLMTQPHTLGVLRGSGPCAVWLHDGPTYWVRALPFCPNDGEPQQSRHYHRLPVADAATAFVLSAVLSSSTFYLFYKWVSNCRDLTVKDWSRFPWRPLSPLRYSELAACGERLAERLRSTATHRTRVYPSGVVAYEEYHPASAKEIVDEIDLLLAEEYGLDPEEVEYILNYDLKYRMGWNDLERDEYGRTRT